MAFNLHHKFGGGFLNRRSKWGMTKLPPVWDVEDAVRLGKNDQTCPYYNGRDSLNTADLVLW